MKDKLLPFWPTYENIDECIKPEAETDELSVLLAVHQPAKFLKVNVSNSESKQVKSENDLLKAFLTSHIPSGTMLLPIIGSSGVGKSHIVRWLDAQLNRQNDGIKRHIIRIPKNSSLKNVLRLIIKDFKGKDYEIIRTELDNSQNQMNINKAVIMLRAQLLVALGEKAKIAETRLQDAVAQGYHEDNNDRLIYEFSRNIGIPALLDDTEFQKHFIKGSLSRIAKRFVEGLEEGEDPKTQFFEEDLDFSGVDLSKAGKSARVFYKRIDKTGSNYKKYAVELLNDVEVLDKALNQLFQNQNNTPLTDIFSNIREKLLEEETELILLVEDFAALAGVQGAMLDIMIKEGIRDGKKILCTMRTALAVTEGYPIPDTVRTRANDFWKMEDVPEKDNDITLKQIVDFVGGYLNAARFGKNELLNQYNNKSKKHLTDWVENFANETSMDLAYILDDFGKSKRGFHLFPFNENVIKLLSEEYLSTSAYELAFNPRIIINNILRDILINFRKSFINDTFPPPDFLHTNLTAGIQIKIFDEISNKEQQKQFISLMYYWGGNPSHDDDLNCIPIGVYKAFGLPPKFIGAQNPTSESNPVESGPTEQSPTEQSPTEQSPTEQSPTEQSPIEQSPIDPGYNQKINSWINILDDWANGIPIPQTSANKLRKWILDGVKINIDWDKELLAPMELDHRLIYIPGAKGKGTLDPKKAMIVIASEDVHNNKQLSTNLRLSLLSVIKYNIYESWDYSDSEYDMARYENFIENHVKQTVKFCHKNYNKHTGNIVTILAQASLLGARILNLEKSHINDKYSYLYTILQPFTDTMVVNNEFKAWTALQQSCMKNRDEILELLLKQVGARQGGGKTIHAVDSLKILEAIDDSFKTKWYISDTTSNTSTEFVNIKNHLKQLSQRNLNIACKDYHEYLHNWLKKIKSWLGENYDKDLIIETLKRTLSSVRESGLYEGTRDYNYLRNKDIPFFRDFALSENIKLLLKLENDSNNSNKLSVLAQVNIDNIKKVENFISNCEEFINKANQNIEAKLITIKDDIVVNLENNIDKDLTQINALLKKIYGEEANDN